MSTTPVTKRKHVKHNAVSRIRHGAFNYWLATQAAAKSVAERVIRDCLHTLSSPGQSAAAIKAASSAANAGVSQATVTLTVAQKAVVSPTNLSFGLYVPAAEPRNLKFGASSGSITVDFAVSGATITRGSGSFITDGFKVGCTLNITGAVDAGNNSSHPVVSQVSALVLTCDTIAADESSDAGVTITTLNQIVDTDGVNFPTLAADDHFTVAGSASNDDETFRVASQTGAQIILTTGGGDPAVVLEASVPVLFTVAGGTVNYGRKYDVRAEDDTATFDRYAGTIVLADGSFADAGFVVGGKVKIDNASGSFNCESTTVRAVSGATLTVARATTGSITVTFTAGRRGTAVRGSGSFITDGFEVGMDVAISAGAADASNRSIFRVLGVSALTMVLADLPASETNDAGVTITSVDFRKSGDAEDARIVQYNTIDGFDVTDIVAGCNLIGHTDPDDTGSTEFYVKVASIASDVIFCEAPTDAQFVEQFAGYQYSFPFAGVEDRGGLGVLFIANRIKRAAGDMENDGFAAAEPIVIAAADADNVDGHYTLRSTDNTLAYVTGWFRNQVLRDANATIKGFFKLTRGAGDWDADGFKLGKSLQFKGTANTGANDAIVCKVDKVVSATVIETNQQLAAETATASVKAVLLSLGGR